MNSLWNLFQPAPFIQEIQDPEVVKKEYHYWRIRILYSMFIGYMLYYFTRKSFTFAMPGLKDMGFDNSDLGLLASILSVTYGISKFASGIISDRSNPRYFMAFGLMMTGVLNICFGLSSSMLFFAIFWGLNGWFQGFGWPPCARFLTHWYSQSERGSWWSTWNVSHNLGAFLIPWIVAFCLHFFGWRYALYIPGIICIFGGFFLINRLRDTPQSLGLPPIEEFRNDYGQSTKLESSLERTLTTREILVDYVIKNPYIWILAFASFFIYVVRTGASDWTALFLIEAKGYSRVAASGCASLIEVGGFCGSLAAGWGSDLLFGARRGPVNVCFTFGVLISLFLFWSVPPGHQLYDSIAMFFLGFTIYGPQMLIGIAAAELSHKKAAATATGYIGCFAYMGAATAGYPFGKLTEYFGWDGYFYGMITACFAALLILIPLWNVKSRNQAVVADSVKPKPELENDSEPEFA